jgi:predicted Zn-dependent protease
MRKTLIVFSAALLAACATAPTGRTQLMIVSDAEMSRMGAAAFDQIKSQGKVANDPRRERYVRCIADALIAELPSPWREQNWEVALMADDSANAFALPGGKVGVNTGLLKVATTPDQVAAVVGHELGHVVAKHGAERMSQQLAAQGAMAAAAVAGAASGNDNAQALALLGIGATVGVLLPYSRLHESEADELGQRYMAAAGFDPRAAATLWENMQADAGGSRPPALLSTHPDPARRAERLAARAPSLLPVYEAARADGRAPQCRL